MEDGPPSFRQGFSCPALLGESLGLLELSHTGLSPSMAGLPRPFDYLHESTLLALQPPSNAREVWAGPRSLATTSGVSFDFLSSRY